MFTMDIPDVPIAQVQQMILAAKSGAQKATTQVVKTIFIGSAFFWDSMDRVDGLSWNIGNSVCYGLQEEGWFRRNGLNTAPPPSVSSVQ
jgi:hypothetical protein